MQFCENKRLQIFQSLEKQNSNSYFGCIMLKAGWSVLRFDKGLKVNFLSTCLTVMVLLLTSIYSGHEQFLGEIITHQVLSFLIHNQNIMNMRLFCIHHNLPKPSGSSCQTTLSGRQGTDFNYLFVFISFCLVLFKQ